MISLFIAVKWRQRTANTKKMILNIVYHIKVLSPYIFDFMAAASTFTLFNIFTRLYYLFSRFHYSDESLLLRAVARMHAREDN